MLRPLLPRRARRHANKSSSNFIEDVREDLAAAETKDADCSYADAERLERLLTEESRRSKNGFFKQEWPRRPVKINHIVSDECLRKEGIEAPTNTPNTVFLSRYPSTKSTSSTLKSHVEYEPQTSKVSLTQTCSTKDDGIPQTSETISSDVIDESHSSRVEVSDSSSVQNEVSSNTSLLRSESFSFGSNLMHAKKWGRAMLQEIKAPLRRHKIRQGKQPAPFIEETYLIPVQVGRHHPSVSKELMNKILTQPSSSQQFQSLDLKGGTEPPKYLSKKALNILDKLDRELARVKELARMEEGKENLLKHIEGEDCVKEGVECKEKRKMCEKMKELQKVTWRDSSNLISSARTTYFAPKPFSM
jgi:hypothetical protein